MAASQHTFPLADALAGDNGKLDAEAVTKLKELRSCTDDRHRVARRRGPAAVSGEAGPTALWAGEMFRSIIGVEIPDDEALQGGQTLVMVRAGNRYPEAMDILHRWGGEYMAAF